MKLSFSKFIIINITCVCLLGLLLILKAHLTSWTTDCFLYEKAATIVALGDMTGGLYSYSIPPLFIWVIAFLMTFGISSGVSAILISMISFVISIFMIYRIMELLSGKGWGVTVSILIAVHPRFLGYAVVPIRTSLYIMLVCSILLTTINSLKDKKGLTPILLFSCIAVSLLRPEGIEIPLLTFTFLITNAYMNHNRSLLIKHVMTVVFLLIIIGTVAWYYHDICGATWRATSYLQRPLENISSSTVLKLPTRLGNMFLEMVEAVYIPFFLIILLGFFNLIKMRKVIKKEKCLLIFMFFSLLLLRIISSSIGIPCGRRHLCIIAILAILVFIPDGVIVFHKWLTKKLHFLKQEHIFITFILLTVLISVPKSFRDRSKRSLHAPFGIRINKINNSLINRKTNKMGENSKLQINKINTEDTSYGFTKKSV